MTQHALSSDQPYLKAAFSVLGLSEIEGPRHEKKVLAMYAASGHPEIHDDETPWCAAYVGWSLEEGGLTGTHSLMAISYAHYGVALDRHKLIPRGAIAVWQRTGGNHVNFVLADDGTYVTCIGGNQENGKGGGVTISRRLKSQAVAYRMPPGQPVAFVAPPAPDSTPEPAPTAVVPVDAAPAEQEQQIQDSAERDAEPRASWLRRKWKGATAWVSGGGVAGIAAYLTDPWAIVAIIGSLLVVALVVGIAVVWFMGPGDVRAWVRKQVT